MVVAIDACKVGMDGEGRLPLRLGPRGVELVAPARLETSAGELQRTQLVIAVALGERQLILQAAQDEVVARHLGDDADSRIAQRRNAGADVGAGRFDIAPDTAEQIELP